MNESHSDALVFFGATGDLAYKKIFPSLQAMVKRGTLNVPVVCVAKSGWNIDQLRARVQDSLEKHGGLDRTAFDKLCSLLRYIDGDYSETETFQSIRRELGSAERPAHYLAIPPALFGQVVEQLGQSGCARGARVIVEKPFGTDLDSAQKLNLILLKTFKEKEIFRIDHYLGKSPVYNMLYNRFTNSFLEPFWSRNSVESVQITMAEDFGVQGRGAFYDKTGAIRDVVQNHLLQILTNLAMEPPVRMDSESIRDEKVKVLKAIPPVEATQLVRGQFRGYRSEKGVSPQSKVETFAALELRIDSWRWQGIPFYIRAGKCLPVTCTEVVTRLRKPPAIIPGVKLTSNYLRFRISPDVTAAVGMLTRSLGDEMTGEPVELIASQHPHAGEMDAYERVLSDAMSGDTTLFAREDYIEEAWRIVDPVLRADTPVFEYEPGTWGPTPATPSIVPAGGWHIPVLAPSTASHDAVQAGGASQ
jgi:glucose-6-phosphate 1-dehydrogenase